ncbi:hypothetical protein C0Q70_13461 [Pomacea canaliculata]|uniref:Uncharacterized protein n=1 Tax=Pomacea canaliculata TaxID=400727 RepID=A0A2T7NXB1_POMCA|nr:hypothetical protein C0Q70_13461 [Pomacea canaliculata]
MLCHESPGWQSGEAASGMMANTGMVPEVPLPPPLICRVGRFLHEFLHVKSKKVQTVQSSRKLPELPLITPAAPLGLLISPVSGGGRRLVDSL